MVREREGDREREREMVVVWIETWGYVASCMEFHVSAEFETQIYDAWLLKD